MHAAFLMSLLLAASSSRAQCPGQWLGGDLAHGVDDPVFAMVNWDQDGAGPLPPLLAVAGYFKAAGDTAASGIALWNPATGRWSALSSEITIDYASDKVYALAVMPNGDLVAAGNFDTAGGVAVNNIARWNGTTWSPLGAGTSYEVNALVVMPNGDLIAGGKFDHAGGVLALGVARWDGANWSALGGGGGGVYGCCGVGYVSSLAILPGGDLLVGGTFITAGVGSANNIARWDGTDWSPLGAGLNDHVRTILVLPNGHVVVGGDFNTAGGADAQYIAEWDGNSWSTVGHGTTHWVNALARMPNGDLIAGGTFIFAGQVSAKRIARWDGTAWSAMGIGLGVDGSYDYPWVLTVLPNGDLIAGGAFESAGTVRADYIARWDGTAWSALTTSRMNAPVTVLKTLPGGDLVAGGVFTEAPGRVSANRIARWDGTTWSPFGSGMGLGEGTSYGAVYALEVEPDGTLIAGGYFITAGGVTVENVARWNGTAWSGLGSASGCCGTGVNHNVFALATLPDTFVQPHGYWVVVGGSFWDLQRFARWSGSDWANTPITNDAVVAMEPHPDGGLVVGGYFTYPASRIGRFDNQGWTAMGSGMNDIVHAVAVMPNGDVIAGGAFTTAGEVSVNRIARWNGTAWAAIGEGMNGPVYELEVMPNGDLIAGGAFSTAGGVSANYIARWDGSAWSALGAGVNDYVHALAVLPNGDLMVGGAFTLAGGLPSAFLARWGSIGSSPIAANLDGDCDVDQADLQLFFACASGPAVAFGPGCENRDFDQDGDVDQSDFGIFQRCYSGANVPADLNCAN